MLPPLIDQSRVQRLIANFNYLYLKICYCTVIQQLLYEICKPSGIQNSTNTIPIMKEMWVN